MEKFGKVFLINLKKREDRLKTASVELDKHKIKFTVFEAVDGDVEKIPWNNNAIEGWNDNSAALVETTIRLIRKAKKDKLESLVICEDDIMLDDNFRLKLNKVKIENKEWDMFHFGAMHMKQPYDHNPTTVRLKDSFCCHAYAVHSRIYDDYLNLLEMRDRPIDWVTSNFFQIAGRCFAPKENLAFQKPDYSNIRKTQVNYKL